MYGGVTAWPDSHDVKRGIRVIFIVRSALSSCQNLIAARKSSASPVCKLSCAASDACGAQPWTSSSSAMRSPRRIARHLHSIVRVLALDSPLSATPAIMTRSRPVLSCLWSGLGSTVTTRARRNGLLRASRRVRVLTEHPGLSAAQSLLIHVLGHSATILLPPRDRRPKPPSQPACAPTSPLPRHTGGDTATSDASARPRARTPRVAAAPVTRCSRKHITPGVRTQLFSAMPTFVSWCPISLVHIGAHTASAGPRPDIAMIRFQWPTRPPQCVHRAGSSTKPHIS